MEATMKPRFYSTALAVPAVRPKSLAAIIAVAGALFGVTPSQATTVTWDFTGLGANSYGTSQSFTGSDAVSTITLYGFTLPSNTASNLSSKQDGGIENGIGLTAQADHEININEYVQIYVGNLKFNAVSNNISFQFGSTNTGTNPGSTTTVHEGWQIYGSNALGTLGTLITGWSCTDTGSNNCNTDKSFTISGTPYKYYDVTSTNGDALLAGFDANVSAVPLPAALPLFASGLAGLGLLGWRRKRKAIAA
jgi:hypothetical protein